MVFYPEAGEESCTAAIVLDVDPVGMVRGRGGKGGAEDQYVNDRPYVASSLLSVVLSRWFNSALGDRCERKPDLAASELPLEVRLAAVPYRSEAWKVELVDLDTKKAALSAALTEPTTPAMHPRMADVFQEKVAALCRGLENESGRDEARAALRGLLTRIVIPPGTELLRVEGNLGAMLATAHGQAVPVLLSV